MKLKIFTIFLLHAWVNSMLSQCVVSQYFDASSSGPNHNSSFGQSLTACEQGTVTFFAFKVLSLTTDPLAKIELYKGNSYANLVRTVDNYVPHIGWNYINIDAGSGPTYSLNSNEMFRIRLWNISSTDYYFPQLSITNPYALGDMLGSIGNTLSGWDIAFRFSMNGASIPTVASINNTMYPSLTMAIAAAQPNDTIEIIEDFTENISLILPSNVTLYNPQGISFTLTGSFTSNGIIINNGTLLATGLSFNNLGTFQGTGTYNGDFVNNGNFKPGG